MRFIERIDRSTHANHQRAECNHSGTHRSKSQMYKQTCSKDQMQSQTLTLPPATHTLKTNPPPAYANQKTCPPSLPLLAKKGGFFLASTFLSADTTQPCHHSAKRCSNKWGRTPSRRPCTKCPTKKRERRCLTLGVAVQLQLNRRWVTKKQPCHVVHVVHQRPEKISFVCVL